MKIPKYEERVTGTTFRKLLIALAEASSGEVVEFMCANSHSAVTHCQAAADVVQLLTDGIDIRHTSIKFPNDGTILFMAEEGSPKPAPGTIVFNDY